MPLISAQEAFQKTSFASPEAELEHISMLIGRMPPGGPRKLEFQLQYPLENVSKLRSAGYRVGPNEERGWTIDWNQCKTPTAQEARALTEISSQEWLPGHSLDIAYFALLGHDHFYGPSLSQEQVHYLKSLGYLVRTPSYVSWHEGETLDESEEN